jgi:hypothetical protein
MQNNVSKFCHIEFELDNSKTNESVRTKKLKMNGYIQNKDEFQHHISLIPDMSVHTSEEVAVMPWRIDVMKAMERVVIFISMVFVCSSRDVTV